MEKYNIINNPLTNKNYPIDSIIGKNILRKYLKQYQKGNHIVKNKTWKKIKSIGFEFESGSLTPIALDPNGEIVSYLKKDAGWLHLDRDDQGIINDKVLINNKEVIYPLNREVVTLRGIIPGEYIVNLYLYENKSNLPVDVKIKIERVNPTLKLVFFDDRILPAKDTEITVARFFLDELGNFVSRPNQKRILTPYELKGY